MMKKINITSQLVLLFFIILLVASSTFSIIILSRVTSIVENEVYSRLETYANLILFDKTPGLDGPNYPDMNIEYFVKLHDKTIISRDLQENYLINDEVISNVLLQIEAKVGDTTEANYIAKGYFLNTNQQKIFYVCTTKDDLATYSFVFTNDAYSFNLVRALSFQTILVFLFVILVSVLVIYLWSNGTAKRIRRIQYHIETLPKKEYKESYVDDSLDEVGELSRAIETMRIEISNNEETKREMLQNVSHDFKTPISVIKSYAEAQQDGMAGKEASEIIIKQAEVLKHKVNQLLKYNSLEYLSKDREFEAVNMAELINQVVITYKYKTELKFELDLDDTVVFYGYVENLYIVVDNIIDNATRYGKTLIKITLRNNMLIIYNDGEPIDEQFIKNSFKAYEKGSKGQFGLGMSIAKKTIEFFGMDLKVVNENVGVSFVVYKKTIKQ